MTPQQRADYAEKVRISLWEDWASFRLYWPMHLYAFAADLVGGFLFGVALALASVIYALSLMG